MNAEEDIMNEKAISVDDYIRRESVNDAIRYRVCQGQGNKEHICKRGSCAYCGIMEIMCDISSISSSDVQPVIHSRWIPTGDGTYNAYCENCGQERGSKSWNKNDFKYCFGCGAKMDGDING